MQFFTINEFTAKYSEFQNANIPTWQIEASCVMIFSQVGTIFRDNSWDTTTVPLPIKNASMEQLRFMLDSDLPFVDFKSRIKAGSMESDLSSDYSTLALRYLANGGFLFRGNPLQANMGINLPFGEVQ